MKRPRDHAATLMDKARGDALVVQSAPREGGFPDWIVGFHAQQAVEKAIRAVLTEHGLAYPPTHDIEHLLELLEQGEVDPPPHVAELPRLSPYGATLRYEVDPAFETGALDGAWALRCVQAVLAWAEGRVG